MNLTKKFLNETLYYYSKGIWNYKYVETLETSYLKNIPKYYYKNKNTIKNLTCYNISAVFEELQERGYYVDEKTLKVYKINIKNNLDKLHKHIEENKDKYNKIYQLSKTLKRK